MTYSIEEARKDAGEILKTAESFVLVTPTEHVLFYGQAAPRLMASMLVLLVSLCNSAIALTAKGVRPDGGGN